MPWGWPMIIFGATPSSSASSWTRVFPAISATPFDRLRSPLPLAQEPAQPGDHLGRRHPRDSDSLGPAAPPHTLRQTGFSPAQIGAAAAPAPLGVRLHMAIR